MFFRGPLLHIVIQDHPDATTVFRHQTEVTTSFGMDSATLLDSISRLDIPSDLGYVLGVAAPFYGISEVCSRHGYTEGEYFFFPTPTSDGPDGSAMGNDLRVEHAVSHREEVVGPSGTVLFRLVKGVEPTTPASTCFVSSAIGCKRGAEMTPLRFDLIRVDDRRGDDLSFSTHRLELPKEIDREKLLGRSLRATQKLLLVDDHLGILYVIVGGVLWCIYYA